MQTLTLALLLRAVPDMPSISPFPGEKFFLSTRLGWLLLLFMLVFGWTSASHISVEQYPQVELPVAVIYVKWPGARVEQVEREVVRRIEENLQSLSFIRSIKSGAGDHHAVIYLDLDLDGNMPDMMAQIREQVREAEARIPPHLNVERSLIVQASIANLPQMKVLLSGVSIQDLTRAADTLKDQLSVLPEVGKVQIYGRTPHEVVIKPDYAALAALNIGIQTLAAVLRDASRYGIWSSGQARSLASGEPLDASGFYTGYFVDSRQLPDIPIATIEEEGGMRVIRLADISRVVHQPNTRSGLMRCSNPGERSIPCVMLTVSWVAGSDIQTSSSHVREALRAGVVQLQHQTSLSGLQLQFIDDTSEHVGYEFNMLLQAFAQTLIILMVVLLLMMSWRSAILAGVGVIISMVGAIGVLYITGSSINIITIVGLIVSMGLIADIFILILEGLFDALHQQGLTFNQAASFTLQSYFFPSLAGQMTTLLALVPLFFLNGVEGRFLRAIPHTLSAIIIVSYLVAFLIILPLSRYIFDSHTGSQKLAATPWAAPYLERGKSWLGHYLRTGPIASQKKARRYCVITAIAIVTGLTAAALLPEQTAPPVDDPFIDIKIILPEPLDRKTMDTVAREVEIFLDGQHEIQRYQLFPSSQPPMSRMDYTSLIAERDNDSQFGVSLQLKPRDLRDRNSGFIVSDLRSSLIQLMKSWPGTEIRFFHKGGRSLLVPAVQIVVTGQDLNVLSTIGINLQKQLRGIPGVYDILNSQGGGLSDWRYAPDGDAMARYGITSGDLAEEMALTFGDPLPLGTLAEGRGDSDVLLSSDHHDLNALPRVTGGGGEKRLLVDLTVREPGQRYQALTHFNGQRSLLITANIETDDTGLLLSQVEALIQSIRERLPEGYSLVLKGDNEAIDENHSDAMMALMLALALIYLVLVLALDSYLLPLFVITMIPLAMAATAVIFVLVNIPISFYSMIGMIVMAGIVVNDGIVVIAAIKHQLVKKRQLKDRDFIDAVVNGGVKRLGPVLSTSLTTILGLLPLCMVDARWLGLCGTLIVGLSVSTVLVLVILPTMVFLAGPKCFRLANVDKI
ncbi:efflux RND transporter permease subunit [Parendozoicomonas haliclonae]|uniref:Putative efflux pump membrane transporter TtgB n=2 Tax=Parendozoicomonas haliclonae TaxID=1960125 RepID=A0A1X7AFU3_9GAMM|nr:putative efflux pump membrane transporter TtgB [Parendozoicomonas haliclonae]